MFKVFSLSPWRAEGQHLVLGILNSEIQNLEDSSIHEYAGSRLHFRRASVVLKKLDRKMACRIPWD